MAKLNGKDVLFSPRIIMEMDVDEHYDPTSDNAQSGKAVAEAVSVKQDTLVSGTNIKTVNGESLLGSGDIDTEQDLSDYVKSTDYATGTKAGVLKTGLNYGLSVSTGGFERIVPATYDAINTRTPADISRESTAAGTTANQFRNPITPANIDYAVKMALMDDKSSFTFNEKKGILQKIGAKTIEYMSGAGLAYVDLTDNKSIHMGSQTTLTKNLRIDAASFNGDYGIENFMVWWKTPADAQPTFDVIVSSPFECIMTGDDVNSNRIFEPATNAVYKISAFYSRGFSGNTILMRVERWQ